MANVLGCNISILPLKYLGFPSGAKYKSSDMGFGFEESGKKISRMEEAIKSTLSSLPTYLLSLFPNPISNANHIEILPWNFLWGVLGE